ncbi:MAG: sulfite exporter TauE/SafE family protein [Candidatus Omnitrophica bacterium]|nr:sulfite exporter TauE/SafE family protein [Candidatus Omnitrophota bacterium]
MNNMHLSLENINVLTFLIVYGAGILTAFTPCVYPLVPIVVGVIGASQEKSRFTNFLVSLFYVVGMSLMFAILGLFAALTGKFFGAVQSSPIAHLIVGTFIIFFALSFFNVITLPTYFLNRVGAGKVVRHNSIYLNAFVMGVASGLIAAPCTTAVIGALLAFAASKQNAVFGFLLLFTFSFGLGTVLMAIGTFAGLMKALPKSDKFVRIIEKLMGFLMLALGAYFIFKAGTLSV